MKDQLIKTISKNGKIRAYFMSATDLINEAFRIHHTFPTATAALGRTLIAAAMMGAMQKSEQDRLDIQIKGGGELGTILAISDYHAIVKGYVQNPEVDMPINAKGKLDVGKAVGTNGYFSVIQDIGLKEPVIGTVELVSGEIGEDLALYFARSEQIPSIVALGVLIDTDGSCRAAGGYIIQLMPGADEEIISALENQIAKIAPISFLIDEGKTPEQIMECLLGDFEMEILEELQPEYRCDCSRSRIERALISIGKKDLSEIIEEDGKAQLICHFCDQVYDFNKEELISLLYKASR